MEILGILWAILFFVGFILAVGTVFSLPMIWYHAGHISRKLGKIIKLSEAEK